MPKAIMITVAVFMSLASVLVSGDGCARQQQDCPTAHLAPFLGVPNDQQKTLGEVDPQAPAELHNVVVVTTVEHTSPGTYATFRDQGRISTTDRRDDIVFYAIEESTSLATRQGGAMDVTITRRYSTEIDPRLEAYSR